MKVLVTGVNGQLGFDVARELKKRGFTVVGCDISDSSKYPCVFDDNNGSCIYVRLDITDAALVEEVFSSFKPDAVIHCAAWTAVDAAEDPDNIPMVIAVNKWGTANLASACKNHDAVMMYISTDYVFSGEGALPIDPDCRDFKPLNVYGRSKYLGELAVNETLDKYFIVRIAWVFGKNGNNFVKTMLKLSQTHDELTVVNDQIGTPTYTLDLARLLVDMIQTDKYGCYHATNEGGYISWYDFACEIMKVAGRKTLIRPVSTKEYGASKAKRPFNSRLDKSKLASKGFVPLPDWKDAIKRYISEIQDE